MLLFLRDVQLAVFGAEIRRAFLLLVTGCAFAVTLWSAVISGSEMMF